MTRISIIVDVAAVFGTRCLRLSSSQPQRHAEGSRITIYPLKLREFIESDVGPRLPFGRERRRIRIGRCVRVYLADVECVRTTLQCARPGGKSPGTSARTPGSWLRYQKLAI